MLEVFTVAMELVEDQVASESEAMASDAANGGVTMVDALKRAREKSENATFESAKIKKAQEEMRETHIKEVKKLRKERFEEIVA